MKWEASVGTNKPRIIKAAKLTHFLHSKTAKNDFSEKLFQCLPYMEISRRPPGRAGRPPEKAGWPPGEAGRPPGKAGKVEHEI